MREQENTKKIESTHHSPKGRGDNFEYQILTESSHPELAVAAQQIHASGYIAEGFVNENAVESNGTLSPDIDKARGDNVQYYVGFEVNEAGEREAKSTIRKISIPFGGTIEDLPAFQLADGKFYPEELKYLRNLPQPHRSLKEISAFAHTASPRLQPGREILREILQDARGSGEVLIFTMVEPNFNALVRSFGRDMMHQIGDPVPLNDPRVEDGLRLVPAMVDADLFLDQIRASALDETNSPQARHAYKRSLVYLTEGLVRADMSDEVAEMVESLVGSGDYQHNQTKPLIHTNLEKLSFSGIVRALNKEPDVWRQPDLFEPYSWADRQEVRRRVDRGDIVSTSDAYATVLDELFELEHPELKGDQKAREDFTKTTLEQNARDGVWAHFPWSKSLVHFANKDEHQKLRTFRHRPIIPWEEQAEYLSKTVLFGGLSVGSEILGQIVPAGIGGNILLADHDTISLSNLNRIRAGVPQLGMRKTDHAGIVTSELDPYIHQTHFKGGITVDALGEIESSMPDIIFEAVDSFPAKVSIRAFAAKHGIPLIMATDADDVSIIDVERHDLESVEPFNGRLSGAEVESILGSKLAPADTLRLQHKLVGAENVSVRLLESTMDRTIAGLPQLGATASFGASLTVRATREILSGRKLRSGRYVESQSKALNLQPQAIEEEAAQIAERFKKAFGSL